MPNFKFIDLFAGIGGFHQAMSALGGTCVFACDINDDCRRVYKQNFCPNNEFPVEGDINKFIKKDSIKSFDVLCGGFPCQTFSKAGKRTGFSETDARGQLFYRIIDILENHPECKFVFLENVRNLADNKDNWNVVCTELKKQGFIITESPIIETPENFGIPQTRDRVYILGIKKEIINLEQITRENLHINDLYNPFNGNCIDWIKDKKIDNKYFLKQELVDLLNYWEEFLQELRRTNTIKSPFWLFHAGLHQSRNKWEAEKEINNENLPSWKKHLFLKTRKMYESNKKFIDNWNQIHNMSEKYLIHQKFEWNASRDCTSIQQGIIQIRQSGVRVKSPNVFPSLVAMKNIPIIWDNNINRYRKLTVKECAKLQSFKEDYIFDENDEISYKQLGNSVNVEVIKLIARQLFLLGGMINE